MKKLIAVICLFFIFACKNIVITKTTEEEASCAHKCRLIGAYKYKVNPNESFYCECYVSLKNDGIEE